MGEAKAIEPNIPLNYLAKKLRAAKDYTNEWGRLPEGVPLLGGMGTGDLLIGEADSVMDEAAHGFPPWTGKGQTLRLDDRLIDVAGVPVPYAATGYGAKAGVKSLINKLRKPTAKSTSEDLQDAAVEGMSHPDTDMSRRRFLKGMGAATAGAAALGAGGVATHAITKALRAGAPEVAGRVAATTAAKVAGSRLAPQIAIPLLWKKMVSAMAPDANKAELQKMMDDGYDIPHEVFTDAQNRLEKVVNLVPEEDLAPNYIDRLYPGEMDRSAWKSLPSERAPRSGKAGDNAAHEAALDWLESLDYNDRLRWALTDKAPKGATDDILKNLDPYDIIMEGPHGFDEFGGTFIDKDLAHYFIGNNEAYKKVYNNLDGDL